MRTPEQILADSASIAVVGASRDESKPSYSMPVQLHRHGWQVIPVNPFADRIFGEQVYRTLAEVPVPIDMVNIFRPSDQAADVVRQAIAVGARAVWLQVGIVSPEARQLAEQAGIDYVEDLCAAVVRHQNQLSRLPG